MGSKFRRIAPNQAADSYKKDKNSAIIVSIDSAGEVFSWR